jgi:SWI/SNF-related matrix-associated actin-dependent regulator of chromatin subfamily A3
MFVDRHQQEALDFMIQREKGPLPPEFCLWKPMVGDNEGWYVFIFCISV